MGIISFRGPEEGLDYYKQALDLINVIQDIVKNPNASNAVKEMSQELTKAQELSKSRKQEALEAQEIIAQSKEFLEEFRKQKAAHDAKVNADNAELESKHNLIKLDIENFSNEKLSTLKSSEKIKQEADAKLALARQLQENAKLLQTQTENLKNDLKIREEVHADSLASLEEAKKEHLDNLTELKAKCLAHDESAKKLAEEKKDFDLRKKKFYDALKE